MPHEPPPEFLIAMMLMRAPAIVRPTDRYALTVSGARLYLQGAWHGSGLSWATDHFQAVEEEIGAQPDMGEWDHHEVPDKQADER